MKLYNQIKKDLKGGFLDSVNYHDPGRSLLLSILLGALGFFIFYFNIFGYINMMIVLEPIHFVVTWADMGSKNFWKPFKSRLIFWVLYFFLFDFDVVAEFSFEGFVSFFWTIWLTAYWLFELRLIHNNKKLSFRLEYFRRRMIYYWGYAFIPGILVYFNLGHLFLFYYPFIFSTKVISSDSGKPHYAWGLPHNGNWIPFSFEDAIEYGME